MFEQNVYVRVCACVPLDLQCSSLSNPFVFRPRLLALPSLFFQLLPSFSLPHPHPVPLLRLPLVRIACVLSGCHGRFLRGILPLFSGSGVFGAGVEGLAASFFPLKSVLCLSVCVCMYCACMHASIMESLVCLCTLSLIYSLYSKLCDCPFISPSSLSLFLASHLSVRFLSPPHSLLKWYMHVEGVPRGGRGGVGIPPPPFLLARLLVS